MHLFVRGRTLRALLTRDRCAPRASAVRAPVSDAPSRAARAQISTTARARQTIAHRHGGSYTAEIVAHDKADQTHVRPIGRERVTKLVFVCRRAAGASLKAVRRTTRAAHRLIGLSTDSSRRAD